MVENRKMPHIDSVVLPNSQIIEQQLRLADGNTEALQAIKSNLLATASLITGCMGTPDKLGDVITAHYKLITKVNQELGLIIKPETVAQ